MREHSFMDREFGRTGYNPNDSGEYVKNLVGVAMPFKGEKNDAVFLAISDECKKHGLHAQRVDQYVRSGIVVRDIAELIEQAEFLIFDLSHERQNVYYELGYAHGVGNEASEILLIAEEGTQLHYDISGLRVHFYSSVEQLRSILTMAIEEMWRNSHKS